MSGRDQMERDLLAVSSQHIATESEVGMGQRNHPQCKYTSPVRHCTASVSSSPTQCGKSPSCYLPILPSPLPLYCNPTVSPSFLSLAFGFFGHCELHRRHLCLWLVFRVGGSVCTGRKPLLYCCPSPSEVIGLYSCGAPAFTAERQPVDFREVCQQGRQSADLSSDLPPTGECCVASVASGHLTLEKYFHN